MVCVSDFFSLPQTYTNADAHTRIHKHGGGDHVNGHILNTDMHRHTHAYVTHTHTRNIYIYISLCYIAAAVVTVFEAGEGDKRLIAYVKPKKVGRMPAVQQLREFAAAKLPKYMVCVPFFVGLYVFL